MAGHIQYDEECYWGPDFKYNIAATSNAAKAGVSTYINASTGGKLYLCPREGGPVLCDHVGGLWALPMSTATTLLGSDGRDDHDDDDDSEPSTDQDEPDFDLRSNVNAKCGSSRPTSPSSPTVSRSVDFNGDAAQPCKPSSKSRVDYQWFRQIVGGSHRQTRDAARAMDIKLTNVDKHLARLDEAMRVANQRVRPLVHAVGEPLDPVPEVEVVTDTIGSKQPPSAFGTTVAQTWTNPQDPAIYYVTVGKDHTARTSWDGFTTYVREAGVTLSDNMINQSVTCYSDNGTEYLGYFAQRCEQAGIAQSTSTAYKTSGHQPIAEGASARTQQAMRRNLVQAAPNFKAMNLDERHYWDYAIRYGALQNRARVHSTRGELTWAQYCRSVPAPFGARGTFTIQPGDPKRTSVGKQLANRAVPGLLLGTINHKCIMLLNNHSVVVTSDVHFDTANQQQLPHQPHLDSNFDVVTMIDDADEDVNAASPVVPAPVADMHDAVGTPLHVGDAVSVFGPGEQQTYTGVIGQIDLVDDTWARSV